MDARLDELFAPAAKSEKPGRKNSVEKAGRVAGSARSASAAVVSAEPSRGGSETSGRLEGGVFRMLSHSQITVRPQVRQTFPQAEMEELRASIRELRAGGGGIEGSGILQALLITPEGDGFRLVAGERRFRASQSEGVELLPCLVVETVSESAIRVLQLTENALRTPPPLLEESRAIQSAMEAENLSLRNMARLLGKDKSYVEARVNLLKYPEDVQEMVSARADTIRHARHLAAIADESLRAELIGAVRDEGIGEREVKRRIQEASGSETKGASPNAAASTPTTASGELVLAGVLKAAESALKKLRARDLTDERRQMERGVRDSILAMVKELDEILA